MSRRFAHFAAIAMLAMGLSSPAIAQRPTGGSEPRPMTGVALLMPQSDSVTEHRLAGTDQSYVATAGMLHLNDQNGERSASIFYTAYAMKGAPAESRPVTFVFNGGPGASSAYLHLGLVGPKIADFGPAHDGAAVRLRDNSESWLKFTDLVLIDPVGAGWSRAAKADKAEEFWNVRSDAQSLAKAIALYLARNGREASPKFLLGESYGGYRAVKLARALQREQGVIVAGVAMVSPFLDGGLQFSLGRHALGAALQLPSLAAAELDRRGAFSTQALQEAERFAMTDYLVTLAGPPPEGEAAERFYARVGSYAGVPPEAVARRRGLLGDAFVKQSRPGRPEVVSAYDAAFIAADPFPESESEHGADPVLDGYLQALGGLFVAYARDHLNYKTEVTYMLLNREVGGKWQWEGRSGRSQASAMSDMRELLALNPQLRFFLAHGRSDAVTPYMVSRYLVDHLPPIGGGDRIRLKHYKGGHMFYLEEDARAAFTADIEGFYSRSAP